MELQAAAAALALLDGLLGRCRVDLYTDSQYLRRGISDWVAGWIENGWRTSADEPVKNQDLWRTLYRLSQAHAVEWRWLKGHAGHPLNERADQLATKARQALPAAERRAPEAEGTPGQDGVEIYVKAGGPNAEGLGGWGAVLRSGEHRHELSGRAPETTNALLIRAATVALRALKRPCRVRVYADASYLIQGASHWVHGWQARNWRKSDGEPVANRERWEELLAAAQDHAITWVQVKGGDKPAALERAGDLAARAMAGDEE
jgi:ribonuclease HI